MHRAPVAERDVTPRRLRVLGYAGQVIAWVVVLGMLGALVAAVLLPRLAGATPYTILTSSMKPSMPPGTLVVVRPTPVDEIGIGSVITYQVESGEPTVVTHRVVAQGIGATGEPVFRTQGDANDVPDATWVLPVQVKGELWYSAPYLGRVGDLVTTAQRDALLMVVVTGLVGYAVIMFAGAVRERRSRRRSVSP